MRAAALACAFLLTMAAPSLAADAGAPGSDAGAPARPADTEGCVEHVPPGKPRPELSESFPANGLAGHVAVLEVVVTHGKGESVLPHGLDLDLASEEAKQLEQAGFAIPHPDGGAGPTLTVVEEGERAKTTLKIPIVALPKTAGVHEMTLPPLPIAISRASGELVSVCTRAHSIRIDEPIADTPDAKPKENPPARRQLEEWTALKTITYATLLALVIGALVAWLLSRWMRREKPKPPPPPPRPPWEVALEELRDVKRAELVENQRFVEHFDRVSYIMRRYCGDRYGFDGLESTTREMLSVLRRVVPPIPVLDVIEAFLRHADLVKFARLTPSADECNQALQRCEEIVQRTIPEPIVRPPASILPLPGAGGSGRVPPTPPPASPPGGSSP